LTSVWSHLNFTAVTPLVPNTQTGGSGMLHYGDAHFNTSVVIQRAKKLNITIM
jgi:hypothetical protein